MRGGGIVCGGFSWLSEPGYNGWGRGVEGAWGVGRWRRVFKSGVFLFAGWKIAVEFRAVC